ncbi:hypothetical protein L3Q67_26275 [Saccharothrix sp. AJ9571]|nr:hypothetical protein L3Q67_26275 [Saccharothrix sp. AJ9571]
MLPVRSGHVIAGLVAAIAIFFAWKLVTAPDTSRDVLDQRSDQIQAIRDTFTRIADTLPPPGRQADDACPVLADLRYSSDQSLSRDNNAVFIMESQLRHPEVRLAHSEFDLLVGPVRSNLVVYFHQLGPEPAINLDSERDGDSLDDYADELDVALNVKYVVVSRVVEYRPTASGRVGKPRDPARVSLETLVIRVNSGETVCTVQADAIDENTYTCTTILPGRPKGSTPTRRETPVDAISPDLEALADKARDNLQQKLATAGGHRIDLRLPRTYACR